MFTQDVKTGTILQPTTRGRPHVSARPQREKLVLLENLFCLTYFNYFSSKMNKVF